MRPRARSASRVSPTLGALLAFPTLLLLAGAGCEDGHQFISPKTEQGIPGFDGPPPPVQPNVPVAPDAAPSAPVEAKALSFFKTEDSSEWVNRAFKVQARYDRVLVVEPEGKAPATVSIDKLELNAPNASATGAPEALPVTLTFRTLQEAAKEAKGGDLVAVLPGHYQGFTLGDKADAGDEKYIHFKALGAPGEVVIDRATATDKHWMVLLQGAHHVVLQGFNVAGTDRPGAESHGPWSGILINGDFVRTSKLSHHIAVLGNFSHNHAKWGIHSVDSHTVLVQDNLFSGSAEEHAAYFSDGSDDYVIRRNVFFGSNASGLQVNVDPLASLEKLASHPALEYRPFEKSRDWALGLLKLATIKFGANAFPDGRGFNYIIEGNVMNGNGRIGGAAINLAGVRESLIQNNLVYGNASTGIAEWDNGNPFDAASVKPGPQSLAEVTGADALPLFGCFNNVLRDNTVVMAVKSRPALQVGNGSWGTRAFNNVLVNDELVGLELLNTSIWRFDSGRNVLSKVHYEGSAVALKELAVALPDGPRGVTGIGVAALGPSFVQMSEEPWVVLEGNWWKRNPRRPDFHPRPGSVLLAGHGDERNQPRVDLDGKPRLKADIGAYAAAAP